MNASSLTWQLWSAEEIASNVPQLLDKVSAAIGVFSPEHQDKNQAAIAALRIANPSAVDIREGRCERELITLGFALDVLGRRAAAEGSEEASLGFFRAAHELFRGGNAALRPSAPMKQALTNALKVAVSYMIKRVVAGDSDVGLAKEDLEQFVSSAWGSLPPQLALTINEMLLTALEQARVEGEMDVTFHERLVRDNVAAVLAMEVPTRLEAVRARWEDIGQHLAPATVRVAQKNLRRPDSLSTLLPGATWDVVRQAVSKGDGDELRIALQGVQDSLETNLRLRLDAKAEYREPSTELRFRGGVDEFFLEARDLLLRRDSRALEKFSNIHFHKSNNAIAKEWYAYALSLFGTALDIHEMIELLEDAIRSSYARWTARWNLACALRRIPDRADEALEVLLPVLNEDAHDAEVFELCLLWSLEQHRADVLPSLLLRSPFYEAHLLAALDDLEGRQGTSDPVLFRDHFRRIGRILRDPDRVFPNPKESLRFDELDQLARDFIDTSLVEAGVEWFRQRVSYGNEANIFKNWECAALLNERAGDLPAAWRCRERQWGLTEKKKNLDRNTKGAVLRGLLSWSQRNHFEAQALRILRQGWRFTSMTESDASLWESRLQGVETALGQTATATDSKAPNGSQVRPPNEGPQSESDPEGTIQRLAPQFVSVSSVESLAEKESDARSLLAAVLQKHQHLERGALTPIVRIVDLAGKFARGVDEETARSVVEQLRDALGALREAKAQFPLELQNLVQACERAVQSAAVRVRTIPDIVLTAPSSLRWEFQRPGRNSLQTRLAARITNPAQVDAKNVKVTFMVSSPGVRVLQKDYSMPFLRAGAKSIVEAEVEIDDSVPDVVELRVHVAYETQNVGRTVHASDKVHVREALPLIPVAIRYVTLAPVGPDRPDLFHGRERELSELRAVFAGGKLRRLYFVNGIRRVGKSTLIKNLGPYCGAEILPLVFSLEAVLEGQRFSSQQMVRQLCRSANEQVRELVGAENHEMTIPGAAEFELDPPWTVFEDFLQALKRATGRRNVLLCFDEVQRLVERIADASDPMDEGFLSWLRGKIQTGSELLVVCTGSEPFSSMRKKYNHTLWGNMEPYNVSFVDRNALARIATEPVRDDAVVWLPEAIDQLWSMTEGHPWITQILAERVCESLNLEGRRVVVPGDVSRAAQRDASSSHITELWWNESDGLVTSTHRQIAFLILQHQSGPGDGIPETQLVELCQWSGIRSVGKYLDEMRNLEVLTESKEGEEPTWRLRGQFLEQHVAVLRQRALQNVPAQVPGSSQQPLALMLDWENVKISLMNLVKALPEQSKDLGKVDGSVLAMRLLEAASKHGAPRQRWAVADWDRAAFTGDQKAFKSARYSTDISGTDKANASDHVLLEKIHFVLRQHPEIGVFVIGTGDGDFHEAIKTLQEQGKNVILWSTRSSINRAYGESLKGPDKIRIEWLEDLVFGDAHSSAETSR